MAAGIAIGGWLTFENHTIVYLVRNTFNWSTLRRASIPIITCIVLVLPGLLVTTWLEKQVLSFVSMTPESIDIDIPGVSGYRPVVRDPTWNDGVVKCALGIPVVDNVKFEIQGKRMTIESLNVWRTALIGLLRTIFAFATITLLLLLLRVIMGILLRIAATEENMRVPYCPINL